MKAEEYLKENSITRGFKRNEVSGLYYMTHEFVFGIMKDFAKLKCEEQRKLCAREYEQEKINVIGGQAKMRLVSEIIMNTKEPEL